MTTFKNLCELADLESAAYKEPLPLQIGKLAQDIPEAPIKIIQDLGKGITININIQLTLPETTDENVYDRLFSSMKKHLLS